MHQWQLPKLPYPPPCATVRLITENTDGELCVDTRLLINSHFTFALLVTQFT